MPRSKKASMAGGADRISALPDALLQRVLSFLQAQEAVRSCVLARRWRHLWKSMPVLRVTGGRPAQESRKFLDHVIALRGHCPLHACLFDFERYSEGDVSYMNLWIQYALLCQVMVLNVAYRGRYKGDIFPLDQLPLVSQNLTKLKLHHLRLNDKFLDFSSCPALEDLNMTYCVIPADKISSRSLKRLSIGGCYFSRGTRTRISLPCLTSLQLTSIRGRTPFLEDMPALVTAIVTFDFGKGDWSDNVDAVDCGDTSCLCCCNYDTDDGAVYCRDASCECCYGTDDSSEGCVLLKGLSAATNLKLIAQPDMIILQRDLRRCPTFSKLKTLFLSEWGVAGDHHALICILQHTPILENLILQLFEKPKYIKPVKATYNLLEQSFASENLKIVEVRCQEIDETVHNIMKSLSTYGVPLQKINIRQTNKSSGCFYFVCTGFRSKQG